MRRLDLWHIFTAVFFVSIAAFPGLAWAAERVLPPLNTEAIAQKGDVLVHQGEVYQRAAIHLSEQIQFGPQGSYALTPGFYLRTGESDGWETYAPADGPEAGRVKKASGAITLQGSFHFSNDGKTIGVITNFYQAVNAQAHGITRTTRPSLSSESIQRSVIYGGKSGTKIKLAYQEIWKNVTRPSETKFVEYDLADSKMIECHGARLEVIAATPESIRYRVTQGFRSQE